MRIGDIIVPSKLVRGAPNLESDPLYPIVQSIHERLVRFLRGEFYKKLRFRDNVLRIFDELQKASVTISFKMVKHFNLRLVVSRIRFVVEDILIKQTCSALLKFWATIEDNMLPRNHRYCDHQLVCRDWWLGMLEATTVPARPVPPYRPMAIADRKSIYIDLWYEKHRLQLYGVLTKKRYQEMLDKGAVFFCND